jgi:hypothetical protein
MKIKTIFTLVLFFTFLSCSDDDGDNSEDSSTGSNLVGDGEVQIPEIDIEIEIPGIEEGETIEEKPPVPQPPVDLVRAIYSEEAYYMSAARTNDLDKKWLDAKITFNEVTEISFPNDFAELFIFNIESDAKYEGKRLISDYVRDLSDAWVSFSFKSNLIDERIQFCGQPVFKNGIKYTKPVKNYPNYVFADTEHSHGIHIGQQEILKKWRKSFIAYHNDEDGNIIECSSAAEIPSHQLSVKSQEEIDSYFTIAPSTAVLKITNGISIYQYLILNPFRRMAGLEVVLKLKPKEQ